MISQNGDVEDFVYFGHKLMFNCVLQDLLENDLTASNDSLNENTTAKVSLNHTH